MVYQWKSASRVKADPNAAAEQFEQLTQTVGLTQQTVLDANRPEDAPLHNEFEWSDAEAAELYRLHQAGHLIRSLVIVPEHEEPKDGKQAEPVQVRAYFPIQGTFQPVTAIVREPDKYELLLAQAKSEMAAYLNKYNTLKELQPFRDAFNAMV